MDTHGIMSVRRALGAAPGQQRPVTGASFVHLVITIDANKCLFELLVSQGIDGYPSRLGFVEQLQARIPDVSHLPAWFSMTVCHRLEHRRLHRTLHGPLWQTLLMHATELATSLGASETLACRASSIEDASTATIFEHQGDAPARIRETTGR